MTWSAWNHLTFFEIVTAMQIGGYTCAFTR
jgi:hypothetical protein